MFDEVWIENLLGCMTIAWKFIILKYLREKERAQKKKLEWNKNEASI